MGKGLSTLRKGASSLSSTPSQAYVGGSEKKDANWIAVLADKKSSVSNNREFNEAMPADLKGISNVIRTIWDYSFDAKWFQYPIGFFRSSLEQEILALAYHAAPLEKVEQCVRRAHANRERHLLATLEKAAIQAINNLDVRIINEKGVIAEGMLERLLQLHQELRPKTDPTSLKQIRDAVPFETKEEKVAREKINLEKVQKVFDPFVKSKSSEETINKAIKKFDSFVRSTTQLNRLHLLSVAFNHLGEKIESLDRKRADRFCYEVIGATIEMGFSPRMRKILEIGARDILKGDKNAERQGAIFIEAPHSDGRLELGVNSFFDVDGQCTGGQRWSDPTVESRFSQLLRLITSELANIRAHLDTQLNENAATPTGPSI